MSGRIDWDDIRSKLRELRDAMPDSEDAKALQARIEEEIERARKRHPDAVGDVARWWAGIREAGVFRAIAWPIAAGLFLWAGDQLDHERLRLLSWKLGCCAMGGYLGYWMSRGAMSIRPHKLAGITQIEAYKVRAIIIAGMVIGVAFS